jgi:hypothetical protein
MLCAFGLSPIKVLAQQRSTPRLIFREQLGGRSPARLFFEIDIGKLLAGAVRHDEAGVLLFKWTMAAGSGVQSRQRLEHARVAIEKKLRAGMIASRQNRREHVIPALTDH